MEKCSRHFSLCMLLYSYLIPCSNIVLHYFPDSNMAQTPRSVRVHVDSQTAGLPRAAGRRPGPPRASGTLRARAEGLPAHLRRVQGPEGLHAWALGVSLRWVLNKLPKERINLLGEWTPTRTMSNGGIFCFCNNFSTKFSWLRCLVGLTVSTKAELSVPVSSLFSRLRKVLSVRKFTVSILVWICAARVH